ncbi:AraC family transcriptional regulator, regulatory protein of adaptative response / methylated-DNA-[protein]-cysteine methyltransferase [Alteromonadaceae bacterium Bs31]|nr:AraC family transcriptional regulator, regulatory protein of adaptative response / methylated-DNA-[protein]-cysteine methyltransferase [Alteromonadaceae bacterium Bs31]
MKTPENYQRIAKAIKTLQQDYQQQPELVDIANSLKLSPAHFQRLFRQWCGLSPKQFLQSITLDSAKPLLKAEKSCMETSLELGLSGSARLHDHFVTLDAVSPGELKKAGEGIVFFHGLGLTPLGRASLSWTKRGIHTLRFLSDTSELHPDDLCTRAQWSKAKWQRSDALAQSQLDHVFSNTRTSEPFKLWVRGTNFQVAVWRALLAIPEGEIRSYGELTKAVKREKASRAIGQAVGMNPVAVLIPCHRVIRADGGLGGYRWGLETKKLLLAKELICSDA